MKPIMKRLSQAAKLGLKPPPRIKPSEWADTYRILPGNSAMPGRWNTSYAEYQREMMDVVVEQGIRQAVFKTSSQVGKSSILENILGWKIHTNPTPTLIVMPTQDYADKIVKERYDPMFDATPELRDIFLRKSTMMQRLLPGGYFVTFIGSNSPTELAGRSIGLLIIDEVDRAARDSGGEGDAIDLAIKRTANFYDGFTLLTSTPTIEGMSRIDKGYSESDQRVYYVPCPDCGEYDQLTWDRIKWENNTPSTTTIVCTHCGTMNKNRVKNGMLRDGRWKKTAQHTGIAGFYINELYSPWKPWEHVVDDFLRAKRSKEALKVWTNTSMGEVFRLGQSSKATVNDLMDRAKDFDGLVPDPVVILLCAIDVQDDRLELAVWGFSKDEQMYPIDNHIIKGVPSTEQPWDEADEFRAKIYERMDGQTMPIYATFVDSGGHFTSHVYNYAAARKSTRVFPIKGVGGHGKPLVSAPWTKKSSRNKTGLWLVGVDEAKDVFYSRVEERDKLAEGYIHFSRSDFFDKEWYNQLLSERKTYEKGVQKYVQVYQRNEQLDLVVYCIAGLRIIAPNYRAFLNRLDEIYVKGSEKIIDNEKYMPIITGTQQQTRRKTRRSVSNYLSR